jgi:hypothetical protein
MVTTTTNKCKPYGAILGRWHARGWVTPTVARSLARGDGRSERMRSGGLRADPAAIGPCGRASLLEKG